MCPRVLGGGGAYREIAFFYTDKNLFARPQLLRLLSYKLRLVYNATSLIRHCARHRMMKFM
jgi:hypothetical protein